MTAPTGTDRRAELLELLRRKRRQQELAADQITAEPWAGPTELSSQQRGLWLAGELDPENASYNMITVLRVRGPLDVTALRTALAGLTARHEGLRTSFAVVDGAPRMFVDPAPGRVWLSEFDLAGVPEASRAEHARRLVTNCCQDPIDLRFAPLLRMFTARIAEDDHVLGYVVHHIVSDGSSMPVLAADLREFYRAAVAGTEPDLPPQVVQPSDVYRWQQGRRSDDSVKQRLARLADQLAGVPPLRLPLDRPRPATSGSTGGDLNVPLEPGLLHRTHELARATGRTSFAVELAAFAVLLQQRSEQYDLAIGTVFSGRTRTETEPLVGYFANLATLRVRTAAEQPVGQLIRQCHDLLLDAQRTQDIPFADVVSAVAPVREAGPTPLFGVCFTLAAAGHTGVAPVLDGLDVTTIWVTTRGSRFDLTFQVTEYGDGRAALQLEYAAELYDEATIRRLATDYNDVLSTMVTAANLDRISVGEVQELAGLNRTIETAAPASEPAPEDDPGGLREQLSAIWQDVLGLESGFSDEENFFEVGGTSLAAVRLRARINSQFGVDLPLSEIYAGGSIAELLPEIEAALMAEPLSEADETGPAQPGLPESRKAST